MKPGFARPIIRKHNKANCLLQKLELPFTTSGLETESVYKQLLLQTEPKTSDLARFNETSRSPYVTITERVLVGDFIEVIVSYVRWVPIWVH